jgi:probable O-glycosylation ligase (exosortase A-associated)
MRALIVLAAFGSLLVLATTHPQVGLYAWGWLTLMQPHQEAWGLRGFRLNLVVAIATIIFWILSREPKKLPPGPTSVLILAFMMWMVVAQIASLRPSYSWDYFDQFIRVMIFTTLCLIMLNTKARMHGMIWILCISVGYYALKGGIFTVLTGGAYHVFGPINTMINDNNHLGGAAVFIIPLLNYLRINTEVRWVRIGLALSIVLAIFCVLGTQSRGAFIALALIAIPFWWRSRNRVMLAVVLVSLAFGALSFMPESWFARMQTIEEAGQDASFQGRVDAWVIATKIAMGNPLTGAGFRVPYLQEVADAYLSEPRLARAAHSIYFEILGSMGFVGLALFVSIIALAFRNASWIRHHARDQAGLRWAGDLANMAQISLMAYCIAGAALSLEFWEGPWLMFVILARLRHEIAENLIKSEHVVHSSRKWYTEDPSYDAIGKSGTALGAKFSR